MSLTSTGSSRRWTPAEDAYLKRQWEDSTDRQLGEALGRNDKAISNRRKRLRLVATGGGGRRAQRSGRGTAVWTLPKGYDRETVAWARDNPLDREARAILAHLRDPAAVGLSR